MSLFNREKQTKLSTDETGSQLSRRKLLLGAGVLGVAGALAACGPETTNAKGSDSPAATAETSNATEATTPSAVETTAAPAEIDVTASDYYNALSDTDKQTFDRLYAMDVREVAISSSFEERAILGQVLLNVYNEQTSLVKDMVHEGLTAPDSIKEDNDELFNSYLGIITNGVDKDYLYANIDTGIANYPYYQTRMKFSIINKLSLVGDEKMTRDAEMILLSTFVITATNNGAVTLDIESDLQQIERNAANQGTVTEPIDYTTSPFDAYVGGRSKLRDNGIVYAADMCIPSTGEITQDCYTYAGNGQWLIKAMDMTASDPKGNYTPDLPTPQS